MFLGAHTIISEQPMSLRALVSLSLPPSVYELAAVYAKLKHVTPNQVYNKCLQEGLLAYLRAQSKAVDVSPKQAEAEPASPAEDQDNKPIPPTHPLPINEP